MGTKAIVSHEVVLDSDNMLLIILGNNGEKLASYALE